MRVQADRDEGLQGCYAGIMTRSAAFVLDIVAIVLSFAVIGKTLDYLVAAVFDADFSLSNSSWLPELLLVAWALLYFAYPLGISGRTLGMSVFGLKVVRADGRDIGGWRAVVRVLALPLSFLVFWFGIFLIVLRRNRRALHDLIAGTAVVYAWDARSVRLRFLADRSAAADPPS